MSFQIRNSFVLPFGTFTLVFTGDTGANMRVCLKLPIRNLLLDPSDSPLVVSSNMAADVLLNGQGNSGTILSHFFVSFAEEVKTTGKSSLSIAELASILNPSLHTLNLESNQGLSGMIPDDLCGINETCIETPLTQPFGNVGMLFDCTDSLCGCDCLCSGI